MHDDAKRVLMTDGGEASSGAAARGIVKRAKSEGSRSSAPVTTAVATDAPDGEGAVTDTELEALLDNTLADLAQARAAGSDMRTSDWVLLSYGLRATSQQALEHARARLTRAETAEASETESETVTETIEDLRKVVDAMEALRAEDAEGVSRRVAAIREFQATMDALNAFVGASSLEAAYEVLAARQELLATELAVELLEDKVAELHIAGNDEAAQELERGPLRLIRDVQAHGVEEGYAVFLARDEEQDAAKSNLGYLMASGGPELVAAIDAVLGAENDEELEMALADGYEWLVRPEAVMMLEESAAILRAGGVTDAEAKRLEYLAAAVGRLSALAHDVEPLPAREQIWMALYPVTHD